MQPDVQALCHLRQSPSALRQNGNSTETRQQVIATGELRTGQDGAVDQAAGGLQKPHRAGAALPLSQAERLHGGAHTNQAERLDGGWELRPRSDRAVDQAAGADQQ